MSLRLENMKYEWNLLPNTLPVVCLNIPVTSKDLLLDSLCWLLYLKCPGKRKLREEGCVLVYHSRAQSITVGKSWVQEDKVVGQTVPQYRRRTWWIQWIQMLSLLLLFYQHSTPAHGMVSVTIKVSFPISMITTKHLGTPRSFSLLCLDPVKVAINIVHHWQRQTACLQALWGMRLGVMASISLFRLFKPQNVHPCFLIIRI